MMRTKATKFGNLFSSEPTVNENTEDIRTTLDKLFNSDSAVVENRHIHETKTIEISGEDSEFITENPTEIQISLKKSSANKLPFFKSLSIKLANI